MATRCYIGFSPGEKTTRIVSVYCHWDGYPAHVGMTLVKFYYTEDKAIELILSGDMSALGYKVDKCTRNEPTTGPRINTSLEDWFDSTTADYYYLFKKDGWHCYREVDKEEIALYDN